MTKKPAPTEVGNGTEFNNAGAQNLVSLHRNRKTSDPARLGYLSRLVDRQAQDAEHFDAMCLAAERYRSDPTPGNAVKAHLAARRYEAAA